MSGMSKRKHFELLVFLNDTMYLDTSRIQSIHDKCRQTSNGRKYHLIIS